MIAPFPFAALPAVSRIEREAALRVKRVARDVVLPSRVAAAVSELAAEPVGITLRRTRTDGAARIPPSAIGVLLAPADSAGLAGAMLVDAELALATGLVSRALRQRPPRIVDAARPPDEIAGAFAALLLAVTRRAPAPTGARPLRVIAAGGAQALARDLENAHGRLVTAWFTVSLGRESLDARVSLPLDELSPSELPPLSRGALAAMGETPLALPLVATTCAAGRGDLLGLRRGDLFLVPRFTLRGEGALTGRVGLVAPRAERGLAAVLADGGRLVLETAGESWPWELSREEPMSGESNATLEALDDAPVVVRVELGVVEMKAREWAALADGDVIALGRRLGEPAVLRVGGIEVARGELVQIDGEYGVRIVARANTANT